MLYKHSFSILCGHLNLNQKRKKIEFDRLPVKPTGKPVKPAGIPVRTDCTATFEFKFEFHRYRRVTGLTGPVYRYRTPAVRPDRSVNETLLGSGKRGARGRGLGVRWDGARDGLKNEDDSLVIFFSLKTLYF